MYLARPKCFKIMTKPMILISAIYEAGNKIVPILCAVLILLMTLAVAYVFVKYVITSNK